MASAGGIEIVNLKQFRADIAKARGNVRDLTKVIKAAGAPVLAAAQAHAPKDTGKLAGSAKISASKTTGKLVFSVPYAGRAMAAPTFGNWGSPLRFGIPDLAATQDQMTDIITKGLTDVLTVYGWFQGAP